MAKNREIIVSSLTKFLSFMSRTAITPNFKMRWFQTKYAIELKNVRGDKFRSSYA